MATIWLTYCWADNDDGDVDYVTQKLGEHLDVRLDRYQLRTGQRLWEQIEAHIADRQSLDAWVMYTTAASLNSQACREELAYALDRALSPGKEKDNRPFPLIGLFPTPLDSSIVPAPLRTRLYVSLADRDWVERIVAEAEGRGPNLVHAEIDRIGFKIHQHSHFACVVEAWPREGTLEPLYYAVPPAEAFPEAQHWLRFAGRGKVPSDPSGMVTNYTRFNNQEAMDGTKWSGERVGNAATPATSVFIFCPHAPTRMLVGEEGGESIEIR